MKDLKYDAGEFGKRISEILSDQGLKQKDLIGIIDQGESYISLVLNGRRQFTIPILEKFCRKTNANPAYLLWGLEPKYLKI